MQQPSPPLSLEDARALLCAKQDIFSERGYVQRRRNGSWRLRWKEKDGEGVLRQRSRRLADEEVAAEIEKAILELRKEKDDADKAKSRGDIRRDLKQIRRTIVGMTKGAARKRRVRKAFDLAVKIEGGLEIFLSMRPWEGEPGKGGRKIETAFTVPSERIDAGLW